jgi:hypothetical protein
VTAFTSRWLTYRPPETLEAPRNPPDLPDKSLPSEEPVTSVGFVGCPVARFRETDPPPVALEARARERLRSLYRDYGKLTSCQWLALFDRAHSACVATFPAGRQKHALRNYRRRLVEGQSTQVIAAHTLALELWTAVGRRQGFGLMLESACKVCGLDPDTLSQG